MSDSHPHTLTPHLAQRLLKGAPSGLWCAQLFPLLGSDDFDARDVAHYSRMCRLFRNSLRVVRSPNSGLFVARIPRINVPSTWSPTIYDALDVFKHDFVTSQHAATNSAAAVFEIRLSKGVHNIDRKPTNILKSKPDWRGIDLRGPEFSGLKICGGGPDGPNKTTLARGRIMVANTNSESDAALPPPVFLEGFTMSCPFSYDATARMVSVTYKGLLRATSCNFSNGITGVMVDGFNTQAHLHDCICASNLHTGLYVSTGAEVEISGKRSRIVGNGLHGMQVLNSNGIIRIIDLGDDESTSSLFNGLPNKLRRNESAWDYSHCDLDAEQRVYYINNGICVKKQRDAEIAASAAELGAEAAEEMGNLFGDDDNGGCGGDY